MISKRISILFLSFALLQSCNYSGSNQAASVPSNGSSPQVQVKAQADVEKADPIIDDDLSRDDLQSKGRIIPGPGKVFLEYWAIIFKTYYEKANLVDKRPPSDGEKRLVDERYFKDVDSLLAFLCREGHSVARVQVEVLKVERTLGGVLSRESSGVHARDCQGWISEKND